MPGSSLWLLPPKDHPLQEALTTLIKNTSAHFNSPHLFIPHVTITSEISAASYGSEPQAWLDSLSLIPANEVHILFEKLASEDFFYRKLYIKCEKSDGVKKLGGIGRRKVAGFEEDQKAKTWVETEYNPHLSLLYHDRPQVNDERLLEIEQLAQDVGISFYQKSKPVGWAGGRVVLVPTDNPLDEWIPIAERQLE